MFFKIKWDLIGSLYSGIVRNLGMLLGRKLGNLSGLEMGYKVSMIKKLLRIHYINMISLIILKKY